MSKMSEMSEKKCPYCGGTGICNNCKSTGWVPNHDCTSVEKQILCPACKIGSNKLGSCSACRGTGLVKE